jgi:antitoxin component YwqK of YwqJK toxin-antitoxin module
MKEYLLLLLAQVFSINCVSQIDTLVIINRSIWDSIITYVYPPDYHKSDSLFYRSGKLLRRVQDQNESHIDYYFIDPVELTLVYNNTALCSFSTFDNTSNYGECYNFSWESYELLSYYEFNQTGINGYFRSYNNGVIAKEMMYKNDKPFGLCKEIGYNGNIQTICNYDSNGQLSGNYLLFWSNGMLGEQTNYLNGREHGPSYMYRMDGSISLYREFNNGVLIKEISYE